MISFFLFVPLAVIVFAGVDRRHCRKPMWFRNTMLAVAMWGFVKMIMVTMMK